MNNKSKYITASLGLAIGIVIGIFIGARMFRNNDIIEENKLLKDLIFQYENYTIESP
jgi:xanthine/uracil/vitamin C permease (AzgA family)